MNTTKLVSGITPRKLVGTLVVAFALAVGVFGTAKAAQALFVGAGSTTVFDGVLTHVGAGVHPNLTVATNGNNSVTVGTDSHTVVTGHQELSQLPVPEPVKIVAKNDSGHLVARVVNANSASSYGTAGDAVIVQKGTVVSKSGNSNGGIIVVDVNGVHVTFHVNSSTRFSHTSFGSLQNGDELMVVGQDTGSSSTGFVAQQIFAR